MRHHVLAAGAILVCAFTPPVSAADLSYPVTHEPIVEHSLPALWTGWYVGINGGGAWGDSRYEFGDGFTTGKFDVSGGLVGGTVGLNWQIDRLVWGVEADVDWTDIDGSTLCPNLINTCKTSNTWLGTARGRVGYAFGRFLPYITGGVAFGNIKADIPGFGSSDGTEVGWAVGGGVEYLAFENWTAKIEYLHIDLGEFHCDAACSAIPTGTDELRADVVRVGLNYKFGWPGVMRY